MHSITNNSQAPQGVHTVSGMKFIRPGQTRDLELTEAGLTLAQRLSFLSIDGGPLDHDGDGKPGGSITADPTDDMAKLRAEYTDLFGKRPFNGWDAAELQAKIDAKLAE